MAEGNDVLYMRVQSDDSLSSENQETSDNDDMNIIVQGYNEITKVSHSSLAKEMSANSKWRASERNKKSYRQNKRLSVGDSDSPSLLDEGECWTVGMHCRATYEEDSQDYEAIITEIFPNNTCNVEFTGYKNVQLVYLDDLVPSWGKVARVQQEKEAEIESEKQKENAKQNVPVAEDIESQLRRTRGQMPPQPYPPMFRFMPNTMPSMCMPPQPPMPPVFTGGSQNPMHDEALSAMLMSWYMNGFYTGVYHAQHQKK